MKEQMLEIFNYAEDSQFNKIYFYNFFFFVSCKSVTQFLLSYLYVSTLDVEKIRFLLKSSGRYKSINLTPTLVK